ncbi:MAG TPA: SufS family cysteine desulfurase [Geminicoccaceae bacterium]|nr:SufS family cysteine desulfurase [Geminicoccus sp.]HMU48468.1 SufS family cysteine desulfurase [Geminicoccaceae bacterium]
MSLDVAAVRASFPILRTAMNGRPLVYLDSAASTQKPQAVIDALSGFYEHDYANIHRGIYDLSQRATALHDEARRKIQRLIGARDWREVIFTRNATEGVNLVARSFLRPKLRAGDEILVTEMEHHANIVPWQIVAAEVGAKVVPAPITTTGDLDIAAFRERIGPRTRMIGVVWVSNVLGTVNPVEDLVALAHGAGVPILIDGAQAVQHRPVDVARLGADFLVFSGHKMYGPSGTGVLWGKAELLEAMPPYQGGGDMIERVSFDGTTFNDIPFRFEAGTPDIAGIAALGTAVDFIESIGIEAIHDHETALMAHMERAVRQVPGLRLIAEPRERSGALTFVMEGCHPQDIGTILDLDGIAIRTGHHCAMPLHDRLGLAASARASLGVYNDESDVEALVRSLHRVAGMFG